MAAMYERCSLATRSCGEKGRQKASRRVSPIERVVGKRYSKPNYRPAMGRFSLLACIRILITLPHLPRLVY